MTLQSVPAWRSLLKRKSGSAKWQPAGSSLVNAEGSGNLVVCNAFHRSSENLQNRLAPRVGAPVVFGLIRAIEVKETSERHLREDSAFGDAQDRALAYGYYFSDMQ